MFSPRTPYAPLRTPVWETLTQRKHLCFETAAVLLLFFSWKKCNIWIVLSEEEKQNRRNVSLQTCLISLSGWFDLLPLTKPWAAVTSVFAT